MKRLTDEEMDAMQKSIIENVDLGWNSKASEASNLIIIELLQRQMEGKK